MSNEIEELEEMEESNTIDSDGNTVEKKKSFSKGVANTLLVDFVKLIESMPTLEDGISERKEILSRLNTLIADEFTPTKGGSVTQFAPEERADGLYVYCSIAQMYYHEKFIVKTYGVKDKVRQLIYKGQSVANAREQRAINKKITDTKMKMVGLMFSSKQEDKDAALKMNDLVQELEALSVNVEHFRKIEQELREAPAVDASADLV